MLLGVITYTVLIAFLKSSGLPYEDFGKSPYKSQIDVLASHEEIMVLFENLLVLRNIPVIFISHIS